MCYVNIYVQFVVISCILFVICNFIQLCTFVITIYDCKCHTWPQKRMIRLGRCRSCVCYTSFRSCVTCESSALSRVSFVIHLCRNNVTWLGPAISSLSCSLIRILLRNIDVQPNSTLSKSIWLEVVSETNYRSPFSWQGHNFCWQSYVFTLDWRIVHTNIT